MKRHILYSLYIAVLLALLYFDKVLTFVMNIICKLTHPIQCSGIVLCAIGTVVVIAIEILRRKYPIVPLSATVIMACSLEAVRSIIYLSGSSTSFDLFNSLTSSCDDRTKIRLLIAGTSTRRSSVSPSFCASTTLYLIGKKFSIPS